MDEILKSEIFIAVYGKSEGVSFEEFGGLFRQVHGYNLTLSNYGYTSMRKLLNDMNNLVEVKTINGEERIRCKSPSKHHVVVSNGSTLPSQAKAQIPGRSIVPVPSPGQSSGPAFKKVAQAQPAPALQQKAATVKSINPATAKNPKSQYSQPSKVPSPAVKQTHGPQLRFPANLKPPTFNPRPAAPAVNAAIGTAAAKAKKDANTKQIKTATFLNPKSRPIMPQNVRTAKVTITGQNLKPGLLPTPKPLLTINPSLIHSIPLAAQPGIKSHLSYASACKSNLNMNRGHSGQQFPPNNAKFMIDPRVNSPNVPPPSRAEHRPPIQSGTVIKDNIEQLLNQHNNGLSIFQLQKLYLIKFQQPLRFRGSTTLKQLLAALKDVVIMEGIGVQMLVYPVSARENPHAPASGDQDAAVSYLKYFQKEVDWHQHSADSIKSQNGELQEAAPLSLGVDHILVPGLNTKHGPKQNASQESPLPQMILHSSGFSFVMEKRIHDPHNKLSEMKLPNNPGSRNEQEPPSHSNMLQGPGHLQQILPNANASALLPDTNPPKSVVSRVQPMEHVLQPHNSRNVMGTHVQASPALQTENCYTSEYPALPTRLNFKPKLVLPIEDPPSIQKSKAQEKIEYEQGVPSNGKDVQTKKVIEKASQDEAKTSQPTSDPTKTDDSHVPGIEQSVPMASDLQKTVPIHPSKSNALQNIQPEKCSDPKTIVQTCVLSSKPQQEFVLSPPNPPEQQQEASVEQSAPENNWETTSEPDYVSAWQTSQKQVCCIL